MGSSVNIWTVFLKVWSFFCAQWTQTTPPLALMEITLPFFCPQLRLTGQIFRRADAGRSCLNQSHVPQVQIDSTAVHSNPSDPTSQESVGVSLAGLMTCWSQDCFVSEQPASPTRPAACMAMSLLDCGTTLEVELLL